MRLPHLTALLAALPLALAGCGGSDDTAAPAPATSAPAASASAEPTATTTASPSATTGATAGPKAVDELAPGDCFTDVEGGLNEVDDLPVVPCDSPHAHEVFALLEQPDGAFPGAEEVQGLATDGCHAEFEAYVGAPSATSTLTVFPITPTAASWEQGDRQVVCVLTSAEPRTASARGSAA